MLAPQIQSETDELKAKLRRLEGKLDKLEEKLEGENQQLKEALLLGDEKKAAIFRDSVAEMRRQETAWREDLKNARDDLAELRGALKKRKDGSRS